MKIIINVVCLFILFFNDSIAQNVEITNSVVVGGVTSNSARFWVRTSMPSSINIELSENNLFAEGVFGSDVNTLSEKGNTAILNVNGLKSNTEYFYRLISGGFIIDTTERSFWTFPINNTPSLFSFAFGSCQQSGEFLPPSPDEISVFDEIIKHDLRFFLQLGDWGYPDTTDDFPLNNDFFTADYSLVQQSYHNKYNRNYPMDKLLSRMPVDYVYDDHDYMNNNSSALTSSYYIPFRPNDFSDDFVVMEIKNPAGARENSIRGYKENFPGYELANESRGIYHKFKFGNAEIFALDLRSQKSSALNAFSKNETSNKWEFNPPENHSIVGRENAVGEGESQLSWFLDALKTSTATWKFIMSSVPFNIGQRTAMNTALFLQNVPITIEGAPEGATAIAAAFELADSWTGFPDDTEAILNFIADNNIRNVIVLSGDSHNSALDDGTNAGLPEIMSGNLDITNSRTVSLFESFGIKIWNKGGQGISTQEYNDAFGKVTVYGADSVNLSLIDEFGTMFAEHTIISEMPTSIDHVSLTNKYSLEQNYPNPFNPTTVIQYNLENYSNVKLKIIDILGREIKLLVDKYQDAGSYKIDLNGDDLASGVYFYKLEAISKKGSGSSFYQTKKMILLR